MADTHLADRIIIDPYQPNSTARTLKDVADGTVLVGQMKKVFDSRSQTTLIIDVQLVSAEWSLQFSIENEGKGEREKKETTELGLTVTEGKEVSTSVSGSAAFSGWGFSASVNASTETRNFSTIETSQKTTVTDTYTCPPESSIFVYKRKYKFRCRTWLYDGKRDAYWAHVYKGRVEAWFVNEIIANQELISPTALSGQGKIVNNPPSGLVVPWNSTLTAPPGDPIYGDVLMALMRAYPWAWQFLTNASTGSVKESMGICLVETGVEDEQSF